MEQGLFGVVTGAGTTFIEDQIVLLEWRNRGDKKRVLGELVGPMGGEHPIRIIPHASLPLTVPFNSSPPPRSVRG